MRMYVMWQPPDGWTAQADDHDDAVRLIRRRHPDAVCSLWRQLFPEGVEARMFVWKDQASHDAGQREVAWVLTVH